MPSLESPSGRVAGAAPRRCVARTPSRACSLEDVHSAPGWWLSLHHGSSLDSTMEAVLCFRKHTTPWNYNHTNEIKKGWVEIHGLLFSLNHETPSIIESHSVKCFKLLYATHKTHTRTHTHQHTDSRTQEHTHARALARTHSRANVHARTHERTDRHTHTHVRTHTHIHTKTHAQICRYPVTPTHR